MWTVQETDDYERDRRWFARKRPHELAAVVDNAEAYAIALEAGANPLQVLSFGYVHDERQGLYAVDQKHAATKRKLAETRLYLYPELETKTLFLLAIGDKNTQRHDVAKCHRFVAHRRKELGNENQASKIHEHKGISAQDSDP